MIQQLKDAQIRISNMRELLIQEGRVVGDKAAIRTIEAKKRVLKYLDMFASGLAGAHLCISRWEKDDIFSLSERNEMNRQMIHRLEKHPHEVFAYCLRDQFEELYGIKGPDSRFIKEESVEKRQIVQETLDRLELLQSELIDILDLLIEQKSISEPQIFHLRWLTGIWRDLKGQSSSVCHFAQGCNC
jgi:hypothetical protein